MTSNSYNTFFEGEKQALYSMRIGGLNGRNLVGFQQKGDQMASSKQTTNELFGGGCALLALTWRVLAANPARKRRAYTVHQQRQGRSPSQAGFERRTVSIGQCRHTRKQRETDIWGGATSLLHM